MGTSWLNGKRKSMIVGLNLSIGAERNLKRGEGKLTSYSANLGNCKKIGEQTLMRLRR